MDFFYHVQSAYTNDTAYVHKRLKDFLGGLFRFQLEIYHFFDDVCLIPGITSVRNASLYFHYDITFY